MILKLTRQGLKYFFLSTLILFCFIFSASSDGKKKKSLFVKVLVYKEKIKKSRSKLSLKKNKIFLTKKKVSYLSGGYTNKKKYIKRKVKKYSFKDNGVNFFVSTNAPVSFKKVKYSGRMIVKKEKGDWLVINHIPLERYLIGVVSKEVSSSWSNESLKAQAVASRSYVFDFMLKNKDKSYHVGNTTSHQVFADTHEVAESIIRAVEETTGVIMLFDGKPVVTYFHANCGGQTELPEWVWFRVKDGKRDREPSTNTYFKSVKCEFCTTHPRYEWDYSIKTKHLTKKIRSYLKTRKSVVGFKIKETSPSKRATLIEILLKSKKKKEAREKKIMTGNDFRLAVGALKLLSTKFKITKDEKSRNEVKFIGKGFGHGVGLCQWGAKTMGEEGYGYREILNYYFQNIKFAKIKFK